MRQSKGIPKALIELPARVVPGLLLLSVLEYASGGTLWSRILTHISAGLLDPDNVWAFAVTVGLVIAIFFGQLLDALGNVVEATTDAVFRRPRTSDAFDWLQVNEEHAADLAEEKRAHFRLLNSLSVTFLICSVVSVIDSLSVYAFAMFVIAAVAAAWLGATSKSTFQNRAEKLRLAASTTREPKDAT